jgi:dolichol kinase
MLAVITCLFGIFAILALAEILWERKILKGEYLRKFVHVLAGSFIAFWPWLVSWRTIQLLGLAMAVFILAESKLQLLSFRGNVKRLSYGDVSLALAVTLTALLTKNNLFFCIALLQVALADGIAAAIGIRFGMRLKYKVFGHTKTVLGTMAVWLVSLMVISVTGLFGHTQLTYAAYALLILVLPPLITLTENLAGWGLDNIAIPLVVLAVLHLAQRI